MILERILQALEANTAALNANTAARGSAPQLGQATAAGQQATAQADPLGGLAPTQPPPAAQPIATSEQILALIQPHISNDAIKADLGTAMRNLGINGLPEARPDQYGPLYTAFQQVIARHTAGGAAQGTASII